MASPSVDTRTTDAPARRSRPSMARAGSRDMLLTMAVFMVPLALIVWFFQSAGQQQPQVPEVDWQAAVAQAREAKAFSVREPAALPAGWRATKAQWLPAGQVDQSGNPVTAATLELGFLSEDDVHFALDQTTAPSRPYVARVSRQGLEVGPVEVNGTAWTHYLSPDERTHSLVLVEGPVTRVVSSDAGLDRLVDFAGLLTRG